MMLSGKITFFFLIGFLFLPTLVGAYTDLDVKLFNAAQSGNTLLVEELLAKGADIHVKLGVDQWTPLMTASREGQLETVQYLLEQGADPNTRDARFGRNAYHWALHYGHHEIARLLLENGASKELKKPSRFFGHFTMAAAFFTMVALIILIWVLYLLKVVPVLKANGIKPIAFFMTWRLRDELEGYAQLTQAKGHSLAVYRFIKYAYYLVLIVMILFAVSVFKTCQGNQGKSQYEVLKDWHDANLERRLSE